MEMEREGVYRVKEDDSNYCGVPVLENRTTVPFLKIRKTLKGEGNGNFNIQK